MRFFHANIFRGTGFSEGAFCVENGRFSGQSETGPEVDLDGAYVLPGLVDLHIHGAAGADASDGDVRGLRVMADYLAKCGVTAFAAASVTLPYQTLERAFAAAERFCREQPQGCARLLGIRMEGPFFAEKRKGAQNPAFLQTPDLVAFERLRTVSGDRICIVDVAPELPGAEAFIRAASQCCTVSLGHTDTSYEGAKAAFQAGASHVTHLFNAMPPVHHREPGLIGAASELETVTAELICDGRHVHPSAVRMAFKLFPDRICLVSDGLSCCGLEEGTYDLGGQSAELKDGLAWLADGTIAGAATNLYDGLRNAVSFGIPAADAIRAATIRPACVLGVDKELGSIEPGKLADFVVCDKDLNRLAVYVGGQLV